MLDRSRSGAAAGDDQHTDRTDAEVDGQRRPEFRDDQFAYAGQQLAQLGGDGIRGILGTEVLYGDGGTIVSGRIHRCRNEFGIGL